MISHLQSVVTPGGQSRHPAIVVGQWVNITDTTTLTPVVTFPSYREEFGIRISISPESSIAASTEVEITINSTSFVFTTPMVGGYTTNTVMEFGFAIPAETETTISIRIADGDVINVLVEVMGELQNP
jgi:hypothetical protein